MTRARDLAAFVSNADGDIKFDTDTLFIDSSANRVAIGNTAPSRPLHITANPAMIMLEDSDGGSNDKKAQIQVDGGAFEVNARNDDDSSRTDNILVADLGTGNIGIGTNTPASVLHVKGRTLAVDGAAASDSPRLNLDLDGTNKASVRVNRVSEDLEIEVGGSNNITFDTNSSERLRIDADGLKFNGDTAAANALDDYEEGLHSPTLTGSTSGSVGMRSGYQQLSYQVVGNRCTMTGRWEVSGGHSLSGNVRISLPFSTANLTDQAGVGVGTIFLHRTGTDFDQGVHFGLVAFEGDSLAYIYYQPSGTGNEALLQGSQLDSNFEGFINISFPIA